jgi:N-acylneuraminate cytidylyltransferase
MIHRLNNHKEEIILKKVGILPIRAGSKRLPDKNIKSFLGVPLFWWTASALEKAHNVDYFVVSSESEDYIDMVKGYGFKKVKYHKRSHETSQDTSSTESVMKEIVDHNSDIIGTDILVLVQATSPWLISKDIDTILELYENSYYQSYLSAAVLDKFVWGESGKPLNYNPMNRPRSQEHNRKMYIENGGIYTNTVRNFIETGIRIAYPFEIGIYEMPFWTSFEIDTEEDWKILEQIMQVKGYEEEWKRMR